VLFDQGTDGDLVYTVEEGEVEIFRVRDDGSEERLTVVTRGNYFGELAPMFGLKRAATARAVGAAVVTGYSLRVFRERFQIENAKMMSGAGDSALSPGITES
jgi:putative ABC transport system ATP-binding protein